MYVELPRWNAGAETHGLLQAFTRQRIKSPCIHRKLKVLTTQLTGVFLLVPWDIFTQRSSLVHILSLLLKNYNYDSGNKMLHCVLYKCKFELQLTQTGFKKHGFAFLFNVPTAFPD